MWNSPNRKTKKGTRYDIRDIAVLIHPIDQMIDFLNSSSVSDVVHERILSRMDKEELIFAIYQTLQSLLEDVPVPKRGHPGYQEAIVAELLHQTYTLIACELDDRDFGHFAREAAWHSLTRFCMTKDSSGKNELWQLDDLRLNLDSRRTCRSKKITLDLWRSLLLGEGGLWDEFLWDDDWRMDDLMDLPPRAAKKVTALAGIDLDVVHGLPHTPTRAELIMAESYIKYITFKLEVAEGRSA